MNTYGGTLDGFIQNLQLLLQAAWGDGWGELVEGAPMRDATDEITLPLITVRLLSRRPSIQRPGIKPRQIGTVADLTQGGLVNEYRQEFDVEIEFRCYHETQSGAKDLAAGLEEILLAFAGFFKEQGIQEILFQEETEPATADERRLDFPVRQLRYYLRLERVYRIHTSRIQQIRSQVDTAREITTDISLS